jgi:hypothetical protein
MFDVNEYAAYRRREVERKADRALHALDALAAQIANAREDVEAARRWEASRRRSLSGQRIADALEAVAVLNADLAEPLTEAA